MSEPAPTFELQSHSTHSDGALAPAEVVAAAHAAGVELLALSDHDTVDGVAAAAAAAKRLGMRFSSAVEISALDLGEHGEGDLHILGYEVDEHDASLQSLLASSRADRELRAAAMAEALAGLGFALDDERLHRIAAAGGSVGRPHLAEAVVAHPANRDRLERDGLLDPSAFLETYLIEGRPAFRPRRAPSVLDAIAAIHAADGLAVWAHPFWDVADPDEVLRAVDRFAAGGLDGVEVFYVTHSRAQTELLADHCARRGLLSTGSSDFHGPGHREFSRFRAFATYGRRPELGRIGSKE